MKLGTVHKQPGETESYTLTYEDDLDEGDNIQTSIVLSIDPPGELLITQVFVFDPRVKFLASGGTSGKSYKITFQTATADNRILEDEVIIKVKEL